MTQYQEILDISFYGYILLYLILVIQYRGIVYIRFYDI